MTRTSTTRAWAGLALLCATAMTALAAGCGTTSHPGPIGSSELAEAQTFPYYRIYWAGPTFQGQPLVAADGRKSYNTSVGDSVYYGDCARGHGVFGGGGSCQLPLQVTTVIYRLHSNSALGPQRNMLIRGVPATVYDEGRSIELYSGRVAIDIFSDAYSRARAAALELRPLNAAGSATGPLPPPVYCPGLYGPQEPRLLRAIGRLPGHACQTAAAEVAFASSLRLASSGSRARADATARGGG
ncbi:MAG TPA: hypothetical protein VG053_06235 [Solirubrobacteraceae bacterium]|nr:hypothetical protein [Solirubrobacteraceae bacterium]